MDKHEEILQKRLYEFYRQTFNREELLILSAPFSWVNPEILNRLFKARKSSRIIHFDPDFFNQIAHEITERLDSDRDTL